MPNTVDPGLETIGPYRVVALLGRHYPATSYQATAPDGKSVVIDLMSRAVGTEPESIASFHQQVHEIAALDHPNLLKLLGSGEHEGRLYLVHEPWDGEGLGKALKARTPKVPEAIAVFKGILKGLGYLHQRGRVHRDLNPTTVLVSPDFQQVKLAGFNLGKADALAGTSGTLATGEVSLGNIYYMSPEQAEGRPSDARSDLFSAGILFHQLLTGKAPGAKVGLPSQANPELPPEVDTLVLKCLARKAEERYSNVPHLLGDLARLEEVLNLRLLSQIQGISRSTSRLLGQGGQGGQGAQDAGGEDGEKKRPVLLWVGIGVAVVLVAVVVFFLLHR